MAVLLGVALIACRDSSAKAEAGRLDTPALLRVIARSHGEVSPRPATEADRRAATERMQQGIRRPGGPSGRRTPADVVVETEVASVVVEPSAGPMERIRITPAASTLRVGETTTLSLEALDSAGRQTHVPAARWRPDDPGVVRLDRTGAVTATAPGVATIEAWVGSVRTSARVDVLPVVRGQVLTLDGEPAPGAVIRFVATGFSDSVVLGSDGRFEFRPPVVYPGTGELSIQTVDTRSASYHPMVAQLTARETGPELRAVLVPRTWTIRSGAHAGVTVDVSADAALRRWRGAAPFARSAAYEGRRTQRVVGWPPHAFPVAVAFLRPASSFSISALDSVAFWENVRRLERQLGMRAFQPGDAAAIGDGRLGVEVVIDPRIPPAAVTWASWGPSGDLNDARVGVRTLADLRNAPLIAHEMLHALGFGHAAEWRSVMTRSASPGVSTLTAQDVAYVQLIYRVRAAQAAFGADLGFLEAAEGERRARR